jgi:hypothetical protein
MDGFWTDDRPDAILGRAVAFVVILGISYLLARATWTAIGAIARNIGPTTSFALGRPRRRQPWARGEWACSRCRSLNRAAATACERCRAPRALVEMPEVPPATEPDLVPGRITVPAGSVVALEHNAAAHHDGLNGHWRLRVNGVMRGSAARRDGALRLLQALDGSDVVLFDPSGAGQGAYPRTALIAAFEAPRLPLNEPCPERDATPR